MRYTKIETIVEGGPASKSGQIKSGDRIIGVAQDGGKMIDVIGWSSSEIVGLIRGKRPARADPAARDRHCPARAFGVRGDLAAAIDGLRRPEQPAGDGGDHQ